MRTRKTDAFDRLGLILIIAGLIAIFAAGALFFHIRREERTAADVSAAIVRELEENRLAAQEETPEEAMDAAPAALPEEITDAPAVMPVMTPVPPREVYEESVVSIDGRDYLGYLLFVGYDLELPVLADWDFDSLQLSPARYTGSAADDDMVIAAHNYSTHFGILNQIVPGNEIIFTDAQGREIHYVVRETEILAPTAIEDMTSGAWDLTLFTCTYGGRPRLTIRCERMTHDFGLE